MDNKLTILFSSIDAVGHFNACIGLAEPLRDRGHKVVFAVPNNNWKGKLEPQGFHEEWYSTATDGIDADSQSEIYGKLVEELGTAFSVPVEQQIEQVQYVSYSEDMRQTKASDKALREIVAKVKPDVIVIDTLFHAPAIMDAGIPWILSYSCSPIGISNKNVPPAFSGYAINGDRKEWERYDQIKLKVFENTFNEFKSWVSEKGGPELEHVHPLLAKCSPYANIYMFPKELDYTEYRPNPPNWYGFDTFIRSTQETFELPETLKNLPGKLIYFSMGTIGCSEFGLMKRLIGILSKSPHRFIVSKGKLQVRGSTPR